MAQPFRILYILQEMLPYTSLENEISRLGRQLPQAAQENGYEIRIFLPRFGNINERRNQLHEVQRLSGMNIIIDDTDHPLLLKVASLPSARMQVYFIDNEDYFQRKAGLTDDKGHDFSDNEDRMIFYIRGVLETIKKLRWTPDIIQCCGWFSALTPLYIRTAYHEDPFFTHSLLVYSLFNDKFSKAFSSHFAQKLLLDGITDEHIASIKGKVDYSTLLKFAIDYCNAVVASSPDVDSSLIEYATSQGKDFTAYNEDFSATYLSLYEKLLG